MAGRRKTACMAGMQLTVTRGALVLGIIAGQLAINLYLLNRPAGFCQSYVLPLIDNFTWMCWNFMLLTLVIEAHGTNLVRDSKRTGRRDSVVFDLPLSVHWPKLILWTPFTGTSPNPCPPTAPVTSQSWRSRDSITPYQSERPCWKHRTPGR